MHGIAGRRRSLLAAFIATTLIAPLVAVTWTIARPTGTAEAAPRQIDIATPGPLGAVTVIGDSVLLGSALFGPTLPERLAERGWGPIRFRAGEGYTSGSFPVRQDFRASFWLESWRAQGWDAPNVIVNIGANDSGFCDTDLTCARNAILHVVNTVGPGRQIWWPQITRLFTRFDQENNWNTALRQIAAERPDFHTWDWPAELPLYNSPDGTHLDPAGYRVRSARMAEVFTLTVGRATDNGTEAPLPTPTAPASSFVPLPAERIVDTRTDEPGRRSAGQTLRVDFGDRIPDDATAVALYVAAARSGTNGYLAAGPCGQPNSGATVNYAPGAARGAPTITAVGVADDVCIFSSGETDVTVDLQGAFVPGDDGLELDPLPTPQRLVDTRDTGRASELVIDVPSGADAVAVNLAASKADAIGFLSAYPCGTEPDVANVNFQPGPPASGSAIVDVADDGTICVSASAPTDVIVDITGSFSFDGALSFVPVTPTRTLDTRSAIGGWAPIHGADQTLDVRVAPPSAKAVSGTLTVVRPSTTTFVAGYGCVGTPPNASVNAGGGAVAANSLTSAINERGELCLLASSTTTTVFDTTGWWI
ncbi:MAG: SGNH/GDSL hydrolase family protein [Ilumatobacter sp.]|uniref:SGNH/GDSL hydrolase family protein n=1 Tax=Ilumatobacter sp. TaxID=1967498 RepID=UPI003918EC2A